MAAVAKVAPILVSPSGYEVGDKGFATADIERGDPIIITAATPPSRLWEKSIAPASGTEFHGIAVKDCGQGGTVEYVMQGEIDGYTGLTPGNSLTVVGGLLDDTEATGLAQIRATTTSRIYVNVV